MKKIITFITVFSMLGTYAFGASFDWAKGAVDYCVENEILHGMENGELMLGNNITNEQAATLLTSTFLKDKIVTELEDDVGDIPMDRWSVPYISLFSGYTKNPITMQNISLPVTREEFVSALVLTSGLTEKNIRNRDIIDANYSDYEDVGKIYKTLICIAVERGYMLGDNGKLNPKENITRAEACSLIYRVIRATKMGEKLNLGVKQSATPIVGKSNVDVNQAKQWAKNNHADERFINIADIYWLYGELTGICPEILYAQAAKETGFGRYGGNVLPEQNNWAGIKTAKGTGDAAEDHETFETPEDGVRGHFNHMSAYIGLEPIGEPHGRYHSVSGISWAGSIKTLEELGGRWCPDLYYGYNILHKLIEPMLNTEVVDEFETYSEQKDKQEEVFAPVHDVQLSLLVQ